MELERLKLRNFRQFHEGGIDFAEGDDSNITVVHGANGSGKTTLLNAFTWLVYNEVDFDTRPERLASERAMAKADVGDQVQVSVQLEFSHEEAQYRATRQITYEKRSVNDFDGEAVEANLTVKYDDGGGFQERQNPENALDQIIPERLSELFFFDGEDIDELAGIDNQDRIQEAIQNIMGLTILERTTRHLDKVAGRFEDEVEEYASDELSQLIQEKRGIEDTIEECERKREDKQRAKERIETEIGDIKQRLERFEESAQLQAQREEYDAEVERLETEVEEINDQLKSNIDDNGFIPVAMSLIRETAEDLDELREEGQIPSQLNNEFLNSLLESKECICGRELEYGTDPYDSVASLRGKAAADGVEQGAIRVVGHLRQVSEKKEQYFGTVDELTVQRKEIQDEIRRYEELIDGITKELEGLDAETDEGFSVADLEKSRKEKEADKEGLIEDIGALNEKIESKQELLEQKEEKIDEQRDEREEALLARKRQRAAELVCEEIEGSFASLKDKVRTWSNQVVKDTFSEVGAKDLTAEIDEDFRLKIWQNVGDNRVEVDKSRGERQIASLAFIGSLVSIAKQRYEADSDADYFSGGIYPVVMDSPFGALDNEHRQQVSKVLPKLAPQVVVFATDAQWEGPVEREMSGRIGTEYSLNFKPGEADGEYPRTDIDPVDSSAREV